MENFIIGLFSQQLSTYIHGFRKEQVNANLLNGKGEIIDIHINVDPVNEIVRQMNPFFEFKSIFISKLSFHITSLRQIQKAPVEIYLDEVHMEVQERLEYHGYTKEQWADRMKDIIEKALKSSSYGISEKIHDNVTFEVNRIYVSVQTMGRLKTRKIGSWTPPSISFILDEVRYVSVDIFGEEGSPQAVWDHNSRAAKEEAKVRAEQQRGYNSNIVNDRPYRKGTVMIYKKLFAKLSVGIGYRIQGMSVKQACLSSHLIIVNQSAQVHLCLHRRKSDCAILAVQIDTSLKSAEIEIDETILTLLNHFALGCKYLFMKNRSFTDPFQSHEQSTNSTAKSPHIQFEDEEIVDDPESDSGSDDDNFDWATEMKGDATECSNPSPILVLQGGAIVWEKISFSFSIHHFSIRLRYKSDTREYLQLNTDGVFAQLIYPSSLDPMTRGCCLQFSCARIDLHDIKSKLMEKLIFCGPGPGTNLGDNFPRFEKTMIREDFFDCGVIFPMQALGFKIVFRSEGLKSSGNKVITLQQVELGVNHSEVNIWIDYIANLIDDIHTLKPCFDTKWNSISSLQAASGLIDNIDEFLQMTSRKENQIALEYLESASSSSIRIRRCKWNIHNAADVFHIFTATLSVEELSFLSKPTLPQDVISAGAINSGQNEDPNAPRFDRCQISVSGFVLAFETNRMDRSEILDIPVLSISLEHDHHTNLVISTDIQDFMLHIDIPLIFHASSAHLAACKLMSHFKVLHRDSSYTAELGKHVRLLIIRSSISQLKVNVKLPSVTKRVLMNLDMNSCIGLLHLNMVPNLQTKLFEYSIKALVLRDLGSNFDHDQSRNILHFRSQRDDSEPLIRCRIEIDHLNPNFVASFYLSSGTLFLPNDMENLESFLSYFHGHEIRLRKSTGGIMNKCYDCDDRTIFPSLFSRMVQNRQLLAHVELQVKDFVISTLFGGGSTAISFVIAHLNLLTGYFPEVERMNSIFQPRWASNYRDCTPGFHHIFSCAQRCLSSSLENVLDRNFEMALHVLDKFEIEAYIHPSILNDYSFEKELYKWMKLFRSFSSHFAIVDGKQSLQNETLDAISSHNCPKRVFVRQVGSTIEAINKTVEDTRNALEKMSMQYKEVIINLNSSKDELVERAFEADRHRLAICAFLSHRMSGLLNMSRSASSGERIVSVHTFWRYWSIATKENLVLFNTTYHSKPAFILSLRLAQIYAFTGSGNKQRYSRAFTIRDNQGKEFFFVAPTYAEYEKWISTLNYIIREVSDSEAKISGTIPDDASDYERSYSVEAIESTESQIEPSASDITRSSSQDSFTDFGEGYSTNRTSDGSLHIETNKSRSRNVSKFREKMSSTMTSGVSKFKTRIANVKERTISNRKSERVDPMERGESNGFKLRNIKVIEEHSSIKESLYSDRNRELCSFNKIWSASIDVRYAREAVQSETMNCKIVFIAKLRSLVDQTELDTTKTFIELIDFHSKLSSLLTGAHSSSHYISKAESIQKDAYHDLATIAKVLGNILTGIDLSDSHDPSILRYLGDSLSAMLNLLLSHPIPRVVAECVAEFLSLSHQLIYYKDIPRAYKSSLLEKSEKSYPLNTREVFNSLDNIQTNLKITENKIFQLGELQDRICTRTTQVNPDRPRTDDSEIQSSYIHFRDTFHTLMKERDEAHSQLISSQVLHSYELERERNKMRIIEFKASYFQSMYNKDLAPANFFFFGQETLLDPIITRLNDLENQVLQNFNDQFLTMSKQMAAELRSRMDAELEISRLKELLAIEKKVHDVEYEKVLEELSALKMRIETVEKEKESLDREKELWKTAYETIINSGNN